MNAQFDLGARISEPHDPVHYETVRQQTIALCAPLHTEDFVVQSMPDASPAKWHLAHTTWFFERFVLRESAGRPAPYDARYDYLFNSYYERSRSETCARGAWSAHPSHHRRDIRLSRVCRRGDARADSLRALDETLAARIELGIHHEQQHQELLLTDLKHAFWSNPVQPVYRCTTEPTAVRRIAAALASLRRRPARDRCRARAVLLRQRAAAASRLRASLRDRTPARHQRRIHGVRAGRGLRATGILARRRLGGGSVAVVATPAVLVGLARLGVHAGRPPADRCMGAGLPPELLRGRCVRALDRCAIAVGGGVGDRIAGSGDAGELRRERSDAPVGCDPRAPLAADAGRHGNGPRRPIRHTPGSG